MLIMHLSPVSDHGFPANPLPTSTTNAAATPTGNCPRTSPAKPIPGCFGQPGCAYIIVPDEQQCSQNYCSCGPSNPAPLLTGTVGGKLKTHCGYTILPPSQCPTAGTANAPTKPGTIATVTPTIYPIDGVTLKGGFTGLVGGGATISPGGVPVTISGHTFSLGPQWKCSQCGWD